MSDDDEVLTNGRPITSPEGYEAQLAAVLEDDEPVDDLTAASVDDLQRRIYGMAEVKSLKRTNNVESQDAFPAQLPRSASIGSIASSTAFPVRPASHPTISRLRSTSTQQQQHLPRRFASNSSASTLQHNRRESVASSAFELDSRRSSVSNLPASDSFTLAETSSLATPAELVEESRVDMENKGTIKWSTLRKVTAKIYPSDSSSRKTNGNVAGGTTPGLMGSPSVLAVNGIVVVGTDKGWVGIFDFAQNLVAICGTEAIAREAGAVTALAISQDHTFVAVGHSNGSIHLYALNKPGQPSRSVLPTTLALVLTGRKEGHLIGSKILHLGFVGARHTALVSSDETGLAFFHSLGKVLMLASTDIIRMLGKYPDPTTTSSLSSSSASSINDAPLSSLISPLILNETVSKSKRSSTILDMAGLPLGPAHHSSDSHALVALLTPTKLVVVGLKPTPRTWWRATPGTVEEKGEDEVRSGVLAWYPSVVIDIPSKGQMNDSESKKGDEIGEDPILAFAWNRQLRLVRVKREDRAKGVVDIEFDEMEGWTSDQTIVGIQWYTQKILCVLTTTQVDIYDITTRRLIGRDSQNLPTVASISYYPFPHAASSRSNEHVTYSSSFKVYKRKIFLLTRFDLRVGAVLSWADRILTLMQSGAILEAIDTTTAYLLGHVDASTIGLPEDVVERREIVEPKVMEILTASLEWVFSEERLRDGSHNDGEKMQALFQDLVGTCVRACLATGEIDWLFDELYEAYEQNGIEGIFLDRIEPYILSGSVHALPPSVSQRLIAIHQERRQYEAAERIIWHVDPEALDLNQVIGLCQRQRLYDALIYVYNRSMNDFVSPLVELLPLVRRIQQHRQDQLSSFDTTTQDEDEEIERTVTDAYKIYSYLSQAFAGLSYPSKTPLLKEAAKSGRTSIYKFLFSERTVRWPSRGGAVISVDVSGEEKRFPYLRLLLAFDAEAMLDALDLAFEESFLEEEESVKGSMNRQKIVDILLQVISPESTQFSSLDRTFLHIFIARNLPKYPQYITLAESTLSTVLIGIATDDDQSTTEDRQLAAEYLLSTYTTRDSARIIELFEQARFYRILRSIYRGERRWAALATTYLRDGDVSSDVFTLLRETLALSQQNGKKDDRQELEETILKAVPDLFEAGENGLQETAELIDDFIPIRHDDVVQRLASTPWRQFAYLRFLLEPTYSDPTSTSVERLPTTHLDPPQQLLYLSLLCTHEPAHVIQYLKTDSAKDLAQRGELVGIFEALEIFDALIWIIDQRGDTAAALDKVDESLESRSQLLVRLLVEGSETRSDIDAEEEEEDEEAERFTSSVTKIEEYLDQISAISQVATGICVRRSATAGEESWFRVLSSLVSTVRYIRSVCPAPALSPLSQHPRRQRRRSTDSIIYLDAATSTTQLLSLRSTELLTSLLPNALSSLVSTTSSREISFPNLMRRLIDSNARSPLADRSYAEFKSIISSLLATYVFESDLLDLTSKITAQDLFQYVEVLKVKRERGWRSSGDLCEECRRSVWDGRNSSSLAMTRSSSISGELLESLVEIGRSGSTGSPRLGKRPSLKGKEVEWPPIRSEMMVTGRPPPIMDAFELPKGVVVGRDGRVWHQSCRSEAV